MTLEKANKMWELVLKIQEDSYNRGVCPDKKHYNKACLDLISHKSELYQLLKGEIEDELREINHEKD